MAAFNRREVARRVVSADEAQRLRVEVILVAVPEDYRPAVGGRAVVGEDERVVFEVEFGGDAVASEVVAPNVVKEFLRPGGRVPHF